MDQREAVLINQFVEELQARQHIREYRRGKTLNPKVPIPL